MNKQKELEKTKEIIISQIENLCEELKLGELTSDIIIQRIKTIRLLSEEKGRQIERDEIKKKIKELHFDKLQNLLEKEGYCVGEILAIVGNVEQELLNSLEDENENK
ncbi:MAG: hypothetical protein EHM47_00825 [Ignavibacteriales bacterium]|nr:MAG: hypothetical protein EHM47_00825 [Ignavibacteriales bacterium]